MASAPKGLSSQQSQALFDLLIHRQLYFGEFLRFNTADGIDGYGPPFDSDDDALSSAPVSQALISRFVLPLPGVKSIAPTFWDNVSRLAKQFSAANLSESYDHKGLGLRRLLAAGVAALLESPAKGSFAGFAATAPSSEYEYDITDADDLKQAWRALLHGLVYDSAVDELFETVAKTPDLSEHPAGIQAAHEFMLINVASVLHYFFVEGPNATYVQKLVAKILRLVPWALLRQSLRIGNVASMINAVMALFLTKLSLTSFTNWVGLSNYQDEGMNMLQQIAWTVFNWDITEYNKKMGEIEESDDSPTPDHLLELKLYLGSPREYQESLRRRSATESKSIITIICDEARLPKLTGIHHDIALDYLALAASVRDREYLSTIVCKSQPDLITQNIRDVVTAFEPIIRQMHKAVDLSTTCQHVEDFLTDFLALFQTEEAAGGEAAAGAEHEKSIGSKPAVTVDQIADVLRKHQKSLHLFLHQMAKGGGDAAEEYKAYVKHAASQFQPTKPEDGQNAPPKPADEVAKLLDELVAKLPDASKARLLERVDDYAAYLVALDCVSDDRLRAVLRAEEEDGGGGGGPGAFLARWQRILDASPSTPLQPEGPVVYGSSRRGGGAERAGAAREADLWRWPDAPDVKYAAELLGSDFRKALALRAIAHRKTQSVE